MFGQRLCLAFFESKEHSPFVKGSACGRDNCELTHILDPTAPGRVQTSFSSSIPGSQDRMMIPRGFPWALCSLLSKGSAFCLLLPAPWSSEHPFIYSFQVVFTVFLRTQCEWNSSHPVLNEVIPPGRALSFSFFLPG